MCDIADACARLERALATSTDLPLQVQREVHAKQECAISSEGRALRRRHPSLQLLKSKSGVLDLRSFEAELPGND
jgi:hypothetical protein